MELYKPPSFGLDRLVAAAESWQAIFALARAVCETGFVPEAFRGKPEETAAAMMAGCEVGLSPFAALRAFTVIKGTAAPHAQGMRAIVQSHGHDIWIEESTDTRAVVKGRRRGSPHVETSVWTMDDAKRAGLLITANGKRHEGWAKYPAHMLVARGTGDISRRIASDAILGLGYLAEELDSDSFTTVMQVEPEPEAPRRARRAALVQPPTPEPMPALESGAEDSEDATQQEEPIPYYVDDPNEVMPEPVVEPEPVATAARPSNGITEAQTKMLGVLMRQLGLTDRIKALQYVEDVVQRPIQSRDELTKREASMVISALKEKQEEGLAPPKEPSPGGVKW